MGRSKLIPARLDASEAPFGFGDVQSADLSHWGGDYNHPEWGRFANAVFAKARGEGATPQPVPAATAQQASGWQTPPPQQQQSSGWQVPPPPPGGGWNSAQGSGAQQTGGTLSPIAYIQKCLRLYIDGKGRARRAEYWWWMLFSIVVSIIAGVIDLMFGLNPYTGMPNSQILGMIVGLALLAPSVSVMSRRLHDTGRSGWIAAAPFVASAIGALLGPLLGGVFSLLALVGFIVIGVLPGNVGSNQYGPDPKAP